MSPERERAKAGGDSDAFDKDPSVGKGNAMHPNLWFDWIFFAIVGIPFVLGIIELIRPSP